MTAAPERDSQAGADRCASGQSAAAVGLPNRLREICTDYAPDMGTAFMGRTASSPGRVLVAPD